MSKKCIDFYCHSFLAGGIETTLIQLLSNLNPDLYRYRLIILYKTPYQEILLEQLPAHIEINYIVASNFLNALRAKRLKSRLPIISKIFEELFLLNVRRLIFYCKIKGQLRSSDVIVDYGMCLLSQNKIVAQKKSFVYNHFSVSRLGGHASIFSPQQVKQLLHYSRVITICDEMLEQFIALDPRFIGKADRIYNYIDQSTLKNNSLASKPFIDTPYILAIGRFDEQQKDFTTLIKGFALAKKEISFDKTLVILGQGRDELMLKNLCLELNVSDSVVFPGFDANPFKWIANCDFFVHSSKYEGLPTVVLEAMILGKCVVASNCPTGVKELLDYGKAGLLFEVGNSIDLSHKLIQMNCDGSLREGFVNAQKVVLEEFSSVNTICKVESILSSLV